MVGGRREEGRNVGREGSWYINEEWKSLSNIVIENVLLKIVKLDETNNCIAVE